MSSPRATPLSRAHVKIRRRQLRKGTHSCWECKRRKMKCVFDPAIDAATCHACRARGSRCISQDFPEDSAAELDAAASLHGDNALSRTALSSPEKPIRPVSGSPLHQPSDKRESLSRYLHQSLPSREITEKIYDAIPHWPALAHELNAMPYTCLSPEVKPQAKHPLEIPAAWMHPVLIGKHMLMLACLLQHLPPSIGAEIPGLCETPQAMSERLAECTISCITSKDDMLGSIEGLECIILESVYHANLGNFRRSWITSRRALSIAQLMGLVALDNRPQYKILDPRIRHNPHTMWCRIVFMDRFLCLLLGLPQGCTDQSLSPEAILRSDTPIERLERIHHAVISRLLEHSEGERSARDLNLTRALDLELQKAARSVPSKWWLTPKLDSAATDPQSLLYNTGRLFAQILHYNLLNKLHLPYMLRSSVAHRKSEHSTITCVNASREILARYIALRELNNLATSCRIIDFIALMAAITLLLAHLDGQFSGANNLLAHQYHSDRAMIEQIQENFQEVNCLSSDALSMQSADLLRKLLAIELDGTYGFHDSPGIVTVQQLGTLEASLNDENTMSVHVPYFGIIRIARQGSSPAQPMSQTNTRATHHPNHSRIVEPVQQDGSIGAQQSPHSQVSMSMNHQEPNRIQGVAIPSPENAHLGVRMNTPHGYAAAQRHSSTWKRPMPAGDMSITPQQIGDLADQSVPPRDAAGLAASTDDWALQGVDMAFLHDLMRSSDNDTNVLKD